MNKDLLRINTYMQVPRITPKPPVSIFNCWKLLKSFSDPFVKIPITNSQIMAVYL